MRSGLTSMTNPAMIFTIIVLIAVAAAFPITQHVLNGGNEIEWQACLQSMPGLDCGRFTVPLDWQGHNAGSITLSMSRFRSNSTNKLGSLIFNPGGPGGEAIPFCDWQAAGVPVFSKTLTEAYDIICPDPRGVGQSNAVKCNTTIANSADGNVWPKTREQFQTLIQHNKALGNSCVELTGDLIEYVDTISAANDLEALRKALKNKKLNYLGVSYGTQLGSQYAELYPESVGRMVLDAALDHSVKMWQMVDDETSTYAETLKQFFKWCHEDSSACGYESSDLNEDYRALILSANESPIPAPGCDVDSESRFAGSCFPSVTGHDIQLAVEAMLLFQNETLGILPGWSALGYALNQTIIDHNATLFAPQYSTKVSNNFGGHAIECLDWPSWELETVGAVDTAWSDLEKYLDVARTKFPLTNGASQSYTIILNCAGWPVKMTNPPHVLDATALSKAPGILIVNARHDPSTSHVWAERLHKQIPGSVLLTREGNGHTSYLSHGEAAEIIDEFLIQGNLPADGTIVLS